MKNGTQKMSAVECELKDLAAPAPCVAGLPRASSVALFIAEAPELPSALSNTAHDGQPSEYRLPRGAPLGVIAKRWRGDGMVPTALNSDRHRPLKGNSLAVTLPGVVAGRWM
jgi:hypothetical protein